MTLTVTQIKTGTVLRQRDEDKDAVLNFAVAATMKEGTLLARQTRNIGTPVITGTGTRVPTVTARAGRTLLVGSYVLVAGTLTSGAGTWTMTAPDGRTETFTTSVAGGDMTFEDLGIDVAIADTGTNFVTADQISTPVTQGYKVAPYSPTGSNGLEKIRGVLTHEITRATSGDESIKMLTRGKVARSDLVIHADGDGDNITQEILDQLSDIGIDAIEETQLAKLESES